MHRGTTCGRPFISLRGVSFRLGEDLVFPRTDWEFRTGQHWAVTGPNGAGKTLLAEALLGRLPPVGGDLRYHFKPPAGLLPEQAIGYVSFEERKADLGAVVMQSRWNSLEEDEAITVRDLLSYERVMEIHPFEVRSDDAQLHRAHAARMRRAVDMLRIRPFLDRTLLSLSNGETQRVELAKALCHPLRLLILDEPYVGLDAEMRRYVGDLLERLMASRLRLLILTTRLEDLPRGISHVAWVERCRLQAAGPRRAILAREDLRRVMSYAPATRTVTPSGGRAGRPATRSRPPGDCLVRFNNLTLRYGERLVLDRLNWTIRAGESWALVGPNGSGKTTLLSLIAGDNPQAYAHDVEVFGRRRGTGESIWDLKRQIGWISPELQLHFDTEISCFDAVGSGFHETTGLYEPLHPRQRQAARACLREFGLGDRGGQALASLSPGWQRIVLLARAAVKRPKLLIADEPCQGLDARHRRMVISALDRLIRTTRVSVIVATHRPDELPRAVKHVLRLGFAPGQGAETPQRPMGKTLRRGRGV